MVKDQKVSKIWWKWFKVYYGIRFVCCWLPIHKMRWTNPRFWPWYHDFGRLELLWSYGALLTSLHRKSSNFGCFLPLESWKLKCWLTVARRITVQTVMNFTLICTPSIKSEITIRAPSYCTITSPFTQWK